MRSSIVTDSILTDIAIDTETAKKARLVVCSNANDAQDAILILKVLGIDNIEERSEA